MTVKIKWRQEICSRGDTCSSLEEEETATDEDQGGNVDKENDLWTIFFYDKM